MKAWKQLHYDRAAEILRALGSGEILPASVPATAPVTSTATPALAPAVKVLNPPIPAPVATEPSPAETAPKPVDTSPLPATSTAGAPVKITPRQPAADRAPAEAGSFFSGLSWAGGEASFDAAEEPDVKPGISIAPANEASDDTPPDRSNPLIAATRSAIVTAKKSSDVDDTPVDPTATAEPPQTVESVETVETTAPAATATDAPSAPAASDTPRLPEDLKDTASNFFQNLNWKNN